MSSIFYFFYCLDPHTVKVWGFVGNVENSLTDPQIKVINAVIDFFGKYNASELVAWSQHHNGAWFKSSSMNQISDDLIIEYFKTLVKN